MLKVVHGRIGGLTGKFVNESRRCSFATITTDGGQVYRGMAICHPNDNFCRAIGRKRALADALKYTPEGPLQKDFRTAIWKAYKQSCRI